MFNRIVVAKIGWADRYQGDDGDKVISDFAIPNEEEYFERWNFKEHQGRVYGSVPSRVPRRRSDRDGWLVVFIAHREHKGPWYAVGCLRECNVTTPETPKPGRDRKTVYVLSDRRL